MVLLEKEGCRLTVDGECKELVNYAKKIGFEVKQPKETPSVEHVVIESEVEANPGDGLEVGVVEPKTPKSKKAKK